MNAIFKPVLCKFITIFFGYILIYNTIFDEQLLSFSSA